jgi:hypothetical protein
MRCVRVTTVAVRKPCVSVDLSQHAKRMRRTMPSMACLDLQYFSNLPHKRHDFRKSYWTQNVFWFSVQLLSDKHFSFKTELCEMLLGLYKCLHIKQSWFLSAYKQSWIISIECKNNKQISNLITICSVAAQLFAVDRGTDITKLLDDSHFANAPKTVHSN